MHKLLVAAFLIVHTPGALVKASIDGIQQHSLSMFHFSFVKRVHGGGDGKG